MSTVKPNLEIWISGYINQLNTLNLRITELESVVSKVGEILDGVKEELKLINNGNKTLIDYFNSEIKKENTNEK